ncbi:GNAT family N-acetyltransferase [Desulfosporosinus sp. BICA1-9]|uniref:GNAT family N-acetyltransferase n=1 Tax=Desulfosporosinus sp. BICA1-9 TaxID=1531958 RepID=UPI000ACF0DFA|nr:GNAT family N-acetyltransferase [Desulfosporosinus sp. BICA1-9]
MFLKSSECRSSVLVLRNKEEWLQVFPSSWSHKVATILDSYLVRTDSTTMNRVLEMDDLRSKVIENTRVNFIFNISDYKNIQRPVDRQEHEIVRTTQEMLRTIQGNVIPKYFWNHEDQFHNQGIGYSLIYDGEVASTAFSSCRFENQLEIGIETLERYRGKGFGTYLGMSLGKYCVIPVSSQTWISTDTFYPILSASSLELSSNF